MTLQTLIDDALAQTPPGRVVWVALSGGLDSSLLLALAAAACRRHPRPLHALHVHHGLQAAADDFERHCRRLCSRLGVALFVERVNVDLAGGQGLEGAARTARYAAFARRVAPGETLWLAQHRDDQAETLLLAALRGSGVRGLAGMPPRRWWRGRWLVRPLLEQPRSALEAAARRQGLAWIDDPSNADTTLDRNYLRHRVLPGLRAHWPDAEAALARSAARAAEADALLDALAALDLAQLAAPGGHPWASRLAALALPRQRLLVRYLCQRQGLTPPPARRLESLLAQLVARDDAQVAVTWPGGEARVWRGRLYLQAPQRDVPTSWETDWDGRAPLVTPLGPRAVRLIGDAAGPVALRVAARRGGERLTLGERGTRDLKRWLQEQNVPPWERRRLLVVWHADRPVALLGDQAWLWLAAGWRGGVKPGSG